MNKCSRENVVQRISGVMNSFYKVFKVYNDMFFMSISIIKVLELNVKK